MSWTRSGTRVPPIPGPRELFRKLFVSDNAADLARTQDKLALHGSILDAVHGDARDLKKTLGNPLGRRHQEKLDEYFTSVRDVEKQLELSRQWSAVPKPQPGMAEPENTGFVSDLPVLYDLIALALQTDSTRIATLEIAGGFEAAAFDLRKDYHALSHHGQVQENIDGLLKLERYQTGQFARFLGKMKSIEDGEGTLLDHSMVLFGSGMANANAHTNVNLRKQGLSNQRSEQAAAVQSLCDHAPAVRRGGGAVWDWEWAAGGLWVTLPLNPCLNPCRNLHPFATD